MQSFCLQSTCYSICRYLIFTSTGLSSHYRPHTYAPEMVRCRPTCPVTWTPSSRWGKSQPSQTGFRGGNLRAESLHGLIHRLIVRLTRPDWPVHFRRHGYFKVQIRRGWIRFFTSFYNNNKTSCIWVIIGNFYIIAWLLAYYCKQLKDFLFINVQTFN